MECLAVALAGRWEPSWEALPQAPDVPILRGDCPSLVGDCLFACLGTWLNKVAGHPERPPDVRQMRLMCRASLDSEVAEMVLLDISTEDPLAERLGTEELSEYIMQRSCWGCHSLLLLWLRTFNRVFRQNLAAVVAFSTTEKPHLIHADEALAESSRLAVCLWLEGKHYTLLAGSPRKVVFDLQTQEWQSDLEVHS